MDRMISNGLDDRHRVSNAMHQFGSDQIAFFSKSLALSDVFAVLNNTYDSAFSGIKRLIFDTPQPIFKSAIGEQ